MIGAIWAYVATRRAGELLDFADFVAVIALTTGYFAGYGPFQPRYLPLFRQLRASPSALGFLKSATRALNFRRKKALFRGFLRFSRHTSIILRAFR